MGFEEHVHDKVFGNKNGVGMAFCFFFFSMDRRGGKSRLLAGTCTGGEGTEGVVTIRWKDVELPVCKLAATYFNPNSSIPEASSAAWVRGYHDQQGRGHAQKRMVMAR